MCVVQALAFLWDTIVYLGRKKHPKHGDIIVAGYQNTVVNKHKRPNAMFIHVPTYMEFGAKNIIDTSQCKTVLKDMTNAVYRSMVSQVRSGGARSSTAVLTFDVYHVVICNDTADYDGIRKALNSVPKEKRPNVTKEFIYFYHRFFPKWPLLIFCFNNKDKKEAAPVMYWYKPLPSHLISQDELYGPGVDAHNGKPPLLSEKVERKHWIIVGDDDWGVVPHWTSSISSEVKHFLPNRVWGTRVSHHDDEKVFCNTDFRIIRNPEFTLELFKKSYGRVQPYILKHGIYNHS